METVRCTSNSFCYSRPHLEPLYMYFDTVLQISRNSALEPVWLQVRGIHRRRASIHMSFIMSKIVHRSIREETSGKENAGGCTCAIGSHLRREAPASPLEGVRLDASASRLKKFLIGSCEHLTANSGCSSSTCHVGYASLLPLNIHMRNYPLAYMFSIQKLMNGVQEQVHMYEPKEAAGSTVCWQQIHTCKYASTGIGSMKMSHTFLVVRVHKPLLSTCATHQKKMLFATRPNQTLSKKYVIFVMYLGMDFRYTTNGNSARRRLEHCGTVVFSCMRMTLSQCILLYSLAYTRMTLS